MRDKICDVDRDHRHELVFYTLIQIVFSQNILTTYNEIRNESQIKRKITETYFVNVYEDSDLSCGILWGRNYKKSINIE